MGSFQEIPAGWAETALTRSNVSLAELVSVTHYGAEYQPIVSLQDQQIWGYEALARFYDANGCMVSPVTVFQVLHDHPPLLGRTELQLKWLQIAAAPLGKRLFINLDPHALTLDVRTPMLELLTPDHALVVELIENMDLQDSYACQELLKSLEDKGIQSALDDIGARQSMLSLDLMVSVDFMKFDRRWIELLDQPKYESLFRHLIEFARGQGQQTILEGVETEMQLVRLMDYPIDYVQGFLYKPHFLRSPISELADLWD
ncbi:EAL domain-containing protein [Pontibacterium granulatum]|uniref:EAL domain-containing protein n=1 Tax=Pontibacterium granulatum TaxID=2036029 RepID=UPI00249CBB70|nr:EAL domain-containing protein [Pontibacterium granulatum]MDI3325024.1 EAL domain-containing protein [Pontibacterium granulatum]